MPRDDKSSYTDKRKRKAAHIEEGYEQRCADHAEAERRACATVNKESGGGNKSGSGRGKPDNGGGDARRGRPGRATDLRGACHAENYAVTRLKTAFGK